MDVCVTCGLFEELDATSTAMIHTYFSTVAPYLLKVLNGVALLWLVWQVFLCVVGSERAMSYADAGVQLVVFVLAIAVLEGADMWWQFYRLIFDMAIAGGILAFRSVGGGDIGVNDFGDLLAAAESVVKTTMAESLLDMGQEAKWWNLLQALAILGLLLVWAYLAWQTLKSMISAYLRLLAVGLLSPFVVALAAFPATRSTLTVAAKILVSAGFQLILSAGVTGLVVSLIAAMTSGISTPDLSQGKPAEWLLGRGYFSLLLTGLILALCYGEIMQVGAQILQVVESGSGISARKAFGLIPRPGGRKQ